MTTTNEHQYLLPKWENTSLVNKLLQRQLCFLLNHCRDNYIQKFCIQAFYMQIFYMQLEINFDDSTSANSHSSQVSLVIRVSEDHPYSSWHFLVQIQRWKQQNNV